ncbi:unnamed protein product [Callosobruchus maculatus]|uniref:Uncharacterized protein n=2 Tax=Callosobruchus maculatus TaxID=64391 RepID=A0A653CI41_CALMS|nr:unnamed protein product [Callosobruchus maculatus]
MRADKTSKCFLRRTVRDHIIPITYAHAPFNKYAIACDNCNVTVIHPRSSVRMDQKQEVVIAISVKQRRLFGQNCKHIINGAKHLHRYLGR